MFDNSFGKNVNRLSKFFRQLILHVNTTDIYLACNMLLHYYVKFESPKNVTDFRQICGFLILF